MDKNHRFTIYGMFVLQDGSFPGYKAGQQMEHPKGGEGGSVNNGHCVRVAMIYLHVMTHRDCSGNHWLEIIDSDGHSVLKATAWASRTNAL